MDLIKVGIVGGTGYTGVELMRLLLAHPQVQICTVTSRADVGVAVSTVYPHLLGKLDIPFSEPTLEALSQCDVVFFATPHAIALQMARPLLDKGIKVIDLSPDFRLQDPQIWEQWYGQAHTSIDLLKQAVYGLPELHREQIAQASLVACPGCYPTAVQLGFLPLLENKLVQTDNLIADVKSGVSGAGRKAAIGSLASESSESVKAYSASGHRHQPEIVQGLSAVAGQAVALTFVPHLMPMIRGIHATLYATLTSQSDLQRLYETRYADETFVTVLPAGSHPDTKHVRRSNHCQIAIHQMPGSDVVVILSVIDNLLKGASGQAVQCFNLMHGFAETTALDELACYP